MRLNPLVLLNAFALVFNSIGTLFSAPPNNVINVFKPMLNNAPAAIIPNISHPKYMYGVLNTNEMATATTIKYHLDSKYFLYEIF